MNRTVMKRYVFYSPNKQYLLNSPKHPVNRYRKQLEKDGIDFEEWTGLAEAFPGVTEMKGRVWNYEKARSEYVHLFKPKEAVVVFDF